MLILVLVLKDQIKVLVLASLVLVLVLVQVLVGLVLVLTCPVLVNISALTVIGTDTARYTTYDFLLVVHSNHGTISYYFPDKWRFWLKIAKFPVYLTPPPTEGVPLGI